jgi:RNA polymerase sigma-70 factor (ECF subfamily)
MLFVMAARSEAEARSASRPADLDASLLVRCKAQDPVAFRAFVVRYERAVFALLSRLLGHGTHVEDLAQEAFLRAYRAFPTFDVTRDAKPSTWLLTIATRLALDAKKKRRFEPRPIGEARDVAIAATPETERARRELGRAIARAAEALSDDQRAAFVLAEFHGLSIAEIASALEIPENTAKTRLFRAREQMRESLREARHGE